MDLKKRLESAENSHKLSQQPTFKQLQTLAQLNYYCQHQKITTTTHQALATQL